MEHVSSVLSRVLEDLGLPEMSAELRRKNMAPIKGGLKKLERQEEANRGMVVTDLDQVPDEAA